jgi:hypothetical protein
MVKVLEALQQLATPLQEQVRQPGCLALLLTPGLPEALRQLVGRWVGLGLVLHITFPLSSKHFKRTTMNL